MTLKPPEIRICIQMQCSFLQLVNDPILPLALKDLLNSIDLGPKKLIYRKWTPWGSTTKTSRRQNYPLHLVHFQLSKTERLYCHRGRRIGFEIELKTRAFRTSESESADFSEVRVQKFRTLKTLRTRTQRVCLFTHLYSKDVNFSQKNSEISICSSLKSYYSLYKPHAQISTIVKTS
jgi:hypothetical protein